VALSAVHMVHTPPPLMKLMHLAFTLLIGLLHIHKLQTKKGADI